MAIVLPVAAALVAFKVCKDLQGADELERRRAAAAT